MRQAAANEHVDVLIVDPSPEEYARLAASLAGDRFVFQFAASGADALRLRPTSSHALWLINIDLPDMSGFELFELLTARRGGTSIGLVGERYRLQDEIQARSCGATMYACKPALPHWLSPWSRRPAVSLHAVRHASALEPAPLQEIR